MTKFENFIIVGLCRKTFMRPTRRVKMEDITAVQKRNNEGRFWSGASCEEEHCCITKLELEFVGR